MTLVQIAKKFWNDERGMALSGELIILATILLLGTIVGLSSFRDNIVTELTDVGTAVGSIDLSYDVAIQPNPPDPEVTVTVIGNKVDIVGKFPGKVGQGVQIDASVNNFKFEDKSNWCDKKLPTWFSNVDDENAPAPLPSVTQ